MINTTAATLKKTLRSNQYIRWWVLTAILMGCLGCLYSREVPFVAGEFEEALTPAVFWNLFGWYWICLMLAFIAHVGLLIWGPGMRTIWFVTTKDPPVWMISTADLVGVILPLVCGETMILDKQKLSFDSFIAASFYTLNVFCIYMAFLPAYDYQSVHIALGIWASIVCFLASDVRSRLTRVGLYLFGVVLMFFFLMFHHWVTSETIEQATNEVFPNDPRAGNGDITNDSQAGNPTGMNSENLLFQKS